MLSVEASMPATTPRRCCSACPSPSAQARIVSLLERNGMGKTTAILAVTGLNPAQCAAASAGTDADRAASGRAIARRGIQAGAGGTPDLPQP
ncbi:MAG: hypothetical protein R3F55_17765 [Alphaproteobacteria bacterium]